MVIDPPQFGDPGVSAETVLLWRLIHEPSARRQRLRSGGWLVTGAGWRVIVTGQPVNAALRGTLDYGSVSS